MRFVKYHSAGNDFIIVKDELTREQIAAICHRHRGIGADGLVIYSKKKMIYFNADGSSADICGNALGCLLKYLFDTQGITYFATGEYYARYFDRAHIVINLGKAQNNSPDLPAVDNHKNFTLTFEERKFNLSSIVLGNIHTIHLCENIDEIATWGEKIANHHVFPKKTNVNFVKIINRSLVQMRTYERGCGLTESCGSGIAAVVAHLFQQGLIEQQLNVITSEPNRVIIHEEEYDIIIRPRFIMKGVIADELINPKT